MNTPDIRFKGFTDAWEQHKVNEVCSISTGKSNTQDKRNDGKYPFYVRSPIVERSSRYLYDEEAVLTVGDGVGTGKVFHYVNGKYDLHQRVYRLFGFSEDVDAKYFYHWFSKNFYDRVMSMTAKTSVDSVRLEMIADMEMIAPSGTEQKKISSCFGHIDNLIVFQQRKLDTLKNYKKAMLAKMFPREGQTVPEIRFKGFSGDWERHKITDVANRFDNLRIPVAANLRISGTTPYYGANGIQDYVEGFTHEGEYVLVAEDGANDLKNYPVKCVNGRIWVNNHAHVLQSKPGIADNKFLAYSISQADIEALLVGGGRAKLNAEVLMGIYLLVPSIQEQIAIGVFLTQIDNLITLNQHKLDKLKDLKQAMLDKMFVKGGN